MPATPVIDVERLNVTYGDFTAVRDLSFHVRRGEFYALPGTNGAGKTSTLEVVEGHRRAASGTVRIFGESPQDRRAVRPRMGILLQESGFSPELTRALPSVISFTLPPGAPEPPTVGALNGAFHIETFSLQDDLYRLLGWAHDTGVEPRDPQAGPTRLDDVFRAISRD